MPRPPSTGPVTPRGAFGWRTHPITGKWTLHNGEDRTGDGNFAPVSGTVIFAGWDSSGAGFGNAVAIRQTGTNVVWWVAHFKTISVHVGQTVTEGQRVGQIGMTGAATGIHTHTERRENGNASPRSGIATNPSAYYGSTSGGGTPAPLPTQEEDMPHYDLIEGPDGTIWYCVDRILRYAIPSPRNLATYQAHLTALGKNVPVTKKSAADLTAYGSPVYADPLNLFAQYIAQRVNTTTDLAQVLAELANIATKGELSQALTSTVALINERADANRDEIISAMPPGGGSAMGEYNLSLSIDAVPGNATGTATPA